MENLNQKEHPNLAGLIIEPNDLTNIKQDLKSPPGSRKLQPMAFTIHFAEKKDTAAAKHLSENFNKNAVGHRRNPSYPGVENTKVDQWQLVTLQTGGCGKFDKSRFSPRNDDGIRKTSEKKIEQRLRIRKKEMFGQGHCSPDGSPSREAKGSVNAVRAVGLSPLPVRKCVMNRRAGYHSEGYFSSDQEEDIRGRSDFFVKKFKNLEKGTVGLRTTNLAQEKKIMSEQNCLPRTKQSPLQDRHEFGDFLEDQNSSPSYSSPAVERKRHSASGNTNTAYSSSSKQEWTLSDDDEEEDDDDEEEEEEEEDEVEEVSNDTLSETGTYTIEKDTSCPEVAQARLEIEKVVSVSNTRAGTATPEINEHNHDASTFKMSTYHDSSNWINEWATHVVKHNHTSGGIEDSKPAPSGLPPLGINKHQGTGSSVILTRIPSPVHSPGFLPPSGRKAYPSPQHTRKLHSPLNMQALTSHVIEPLSTGDNVVERHSDSSLETESFLRTTESVVTAMQARVTASLDSGGESDIDTSHSYQGPERSRGGGARSDSSSDQEQRTRGRGPQPPTNIAGPVMRYNRAFSLRRARLDEPIDKRKKPVTEVPPPPVNKTKKVLESTKNSQPQRINNTKNSKPEYSSSFSRTDSGRFSVRSPKGVSQSAPLSKGSSTLKKDGKKSNPGARSNSTLSSREVEFQNWKRRKSYDPMKAAAEGKKKEAVKKTVMSTSMTQSSISAAETSPSHQNPVLRSASFHGTGGLTPKYVSSEDEVTLSADEDSPVSGYPPSLVTPSPTKMVLEGMLGGSRSPLYSAVSNPSLRGRNKMEALDNLVMAAVCGLSNKLRGSSCALLRKLRFVYEEDSERSEKLSSVIELLENSACGSPQTKSPSKELSGTLKNLKRLENVIKVLDEVLFDEEEFELEVEEY
uniref:Uncharacterized protein n=1 Tax=Timema genevievae TaxID=629358 RepID=A0A7R9K0P7_TIMGE|nr:unnamed protein product [Timema genevievae]